MALIKKNGDSSENFEATEIQNWSISNSGSFLSRRKRIIKANEADFSDEYKEVTQLTTESNQPLVKPIRKGLLIEGVEIMCRCGEKIVVHFDLEKEESVQ